MHGNNCRCGHHWCVKVLVVLAWLSALAFWWVTWRDTTLWWMDAEHLFRDVVILSLLAFVSAKFCGCCGDGYSGKMSGKMCKHEEGCKCGDCDRCC